MDQTYFKLSVHGPKGAGRIVTGIKGQGTYHQGTQWFPLLIQASHHLTGGTVASHCPTSASRLYIEWGPLILRKFLKIAMLHVILDQQKTEKTVLEKAFFFLLRHFYLFWLLCRKIWKMALLRGEIFFLEIGHTGYKKSRILC